MDNITNKQCHECPFFYKKKGFNDHIWYHHYCKAVTGYEEWKHCRSVFHATELFCKARGRGIVLPRTHLQVVAKWVTAATKWLSS